MRWTTRTEQVLFDPLEFVGPLMHWTQLLRLHFHEAGNRDFDLMTYKLLPP